MCGRYTLTSQEGLVEELQLAIGEPSEPNEWWRPRWNIAPTQPAPIVANREGPRAIELARWGLLPPWAESLGAGAKMINARGETAADKRAFRDALRKRRCLVPADGFFEWKKNGKQRTPFWIHPEPRHLIAFAGLWERWKSPPRVIGSDGGEPGSPPSAIWVISFTIVTTGANELVAPLHDRMPVVLPRDAYDRWLDPAPIEPAALADLLAPAPPDGWVATEVAPLVNKPDNDVPACVEAWHAETPPQGSLF
jgi:putative SOS response-associated peptidase YedK